MSVARLPEGVGENVAMDVFSAATGQDHAWIAARVPHAGSMCLLDGVVQAAPEAITCRAASHRLPDHPMRQAGRLGAACGVEYAAQAMAAHGAMLSNGSRPRVGYVASVRSLDLLAERLDQPQTLEIVAERLSGDDDNILYRFEVGAGGRPLLRGRAAVVLRAGVGQ